MAGDVMMLEHIVAASGRAAATRSRTAKVTALADALRLAAEDGRAAVAITAAYLSGTLPQVRVGVGYRSIPRTLPAAARPTLSVADVDTAMTLMADAAGPGSAAARTAAVRGLFERATEPEQQFLRGLILGDTRQGAGDGLMLQAIAVAAQVPEPAVRRAVMLAGSLPSVAVAAMSGGEDALAAVGLTVGTPMRPMLAGSAQDVEDALSQLGGIGKKPRGRAGSSTAPKDTDATPAPEVAVDRKLDGIRIQAHLGDGKVRLFTRSLEDITDRLPEVTETLAALGLHSAVFDGEVIALRPDGRPEPFQVTGARTASSADPEALRRQVPLTTMLFDVMHLGGEDLLDLPARERFDRLAAAVPADLVVERVVTADPGVAQRFFEDTVAAGHEGVVVKSLEAPYAAGRRGAGWVKVKPRHTLDLVVLAVEWGSGRRSEWLSNIHLGARDPATGEFVMLGKTFKGMTDQMLRWQTERFTELALTAPDRSQWVVPLRPEQVVEIAYDGIQRSTRYPGGMALRFARVLRYRDDKSANEADTVDTVRAVGMMTS